MWWGSLRSPPPCGSLHPACCSVWNRGRLKTASWWTISYWFFHHPNRIVLSAMARRSRDREGMAGMDCRRAQQERLRARRHHRGPAALARDCPRSNRGCGIRKGTTMTVVARPVTPHWACRRTPACWIGRAWSSSACRTGIRRRRRRCR